MNLAQMDESQTTWDTLLTLMEQGNIAEQGQDEAAADFAYIDEKASSFDTCAVGEAINKIHPQFKWGPGGNWIPAGTHSPLMDMGSNFEWAVKDRNTADAWTILGRINRYVQKHKDALIAQFNDQCA